MELSMGSPARMGSRATKGLGGAARHHAGGISWLLDSIASEQHRVFSCSPGKAQSEELIKVISNFSGP